MHKLNGVVLPLYLFRLIGLSRTASSGCKFTAQQIGNGAHAELNLDWSTSASYSMAISSSSPFILRSSSKLQRQLLRGVFSVSVY